MRSGHGLPLSRARRIVGDLCVFAHATPKGVITRRLQLLPLVSAMKAHTDRPPWTAVIAKAFALTALDLPQLRQVYVKLPWPSLYQYDKSSAAIVMERDVDGEPALFFPRIEGPEDKSLGEIAAELHHLKTAPIPEIEDFAETVFVAGLPMPIRRFLWWIALNIGPLRPGYFGTFCITTLAGDGATITNVVNPLSAALSYGPFSADGELDMVFSFDHRVFDGALVARALARLEAVLLDAILDEVRRGIVESPRTAAE